MRMTMILLVSLLAALATSDVSAEANRESLIAAWEGHIASLPSTTRFEAVGDGVYQLEDADLPYSGELKIVGALVRTTESAGYETGYSHTGMVDFRLADLPEERLSSQVYYYWLADRQSLHYSETEQRWVDTATFQQSITNMYDTDAPFSALYFMLNYGVWILLIGLAVFGIVAISKQTKKAKSLMDDSASINEQARQNIDRAEGLQDELLAIARETRDLQSQNNELLRKMLAALQK
ncbi:MAG: hypothetical protein KJO09_05100 [Gammaproteobacteria bacterium]|nr:hypothetical protein [Gammaproteobacteria bacterium]